MQQAPKRSTLHRGNYLGRHYCKSPDKAMPNCNRSTAVCVCVYVPQPWCSKWTSGEAATRQCRGQTHSLHSAPFFTLSPAPGVRTELQTTAHLRRIFSNQFFACVQQHYSTLQTADWSPSATRRGTPSERTLSVASNSVNLCC